MHKNKQKNQAHPKFHKTIMNDIKQGNIKRTLIQDLKDIYNFYLDQQTRNKLKQMNKFKRWIFIIFWMLKSLFLKLTPARRILLLFSLILLAFKFNNSSSNEVAVSFNSYGIAFIIALFILMLELKDKLLATDELLVGRKVQFALMPDKNPIFPGWEIWLYTMPANEVGGDLVDYLQIDEKRLGVALGDVAGKGLGAALLMAKLQATIRAIAPNFKSLADLGSEINKIFCRDGIPNRFISLIYLEINPDSGLVRILNSGHMPPILVDKNSVTEMAQGTSALGLARDSKYKEQQIELNQDDVLVIYSDGLTEARNEQGEFFDDDRFLQILPKYKGQTLDSMGRKILNEVKSFVGDARANDDLSLILLKYTG